MVVRERIAEVDGGELDARFEVGDLIDLPTIFAADEVVGVREVVTTAEFEDHIVVGLFAEDLMRVRLVGTAVEHHAVHTGLVERVGDVTVHFAGLERAVVGAELPLLLAIRFLVADRDHAETAVAAVVEALAAAQDLHAFDHAGVEGCGTPKIFERRAAVEGRDTVEEQQGVAVRAAVDADGELAFIRRVTDVRTTDQSRGEFTEVGEAAGVDLVSADELHLAAELRGVKGDRRHTFVDFSAFDDDLFEVVGGGAWGGL